MGFIASSSLLLGGFLALRRPIGLRPMGLIMAFGADVLISAVSYELDEDAFGAAGGSGAIGLGLFVGAFTFYLGDLAIDRFGGEEERCRRARRRFWLGYLARYGSGRHPRVDRARPVVARGRGGERRHAGCCVSLQLARGALLHRWLVQERLERPEDLGTLGVGHRG
jgi:hypothetical protein